MLWARVVFAARAFVANNLGSYSAALTYSCMLAAVPVMCIIFAIGRGFGFGNIIEERIKANIHGGSDIMDSVFVFIKHYLEHTHSGVFLGAGLLLLIYTLVMLTSNVEVAFNAIWHAPRSRNIYRKVVNYLSIFLLVPVLIVVTSGFSVFMLTIVDQLRDYEVISSTMSFVVRSTPVLISMLAFVALYKLMPNTHVRWRSVLVPGIVAGALFQALQYFYINYQLMISSYNAIYGSFAALPLFMIWLHMSWYVCLGGAQISYAIQHHGQHHLALAPESLSRRDHDRVAIYLMKLIARGVAQAEPPTSVDELSASTRMPHALVQTVVAELVEAQLLSEVMCADHTEVRYQPAMDLQLITPAEVVRRLSGVSKDDANCPVTQASV